MRLGEQKLGISKDASNGEIKKAYRKMAMSHHPDKGGDEDEVSFQAPTPNRYRPEEISNPKEISPSLAAGASIRSMAMFSPGRVQ